MTIAFSNITTPHPASSQEVFLEDMLDFFGGWRGGHIARHGYVGEGGDIYSRWLTQNDAYRSQVTLAELELIHIHVGMLGGSCVEATQFIEIGAGNFRAFLMKTRPLLEELVAKQPRLQYTIVDISKAAFTSIATGIKKTGLPAPDYFEGNFFSELPHIENNAVVYMSGLTLTNVPEDAIRGDTQQILEQTLAFFAKALKKGGTFVFSYATADGIDADGTQVKQFYDDPLIHSYQRSIFKRVKEEFAPKGSFDPTAFKIHHVWRPEKAVLTRHAVVERPMQFVLDGQFFDLRPNTFNGYMANNFRPSDASIEEAARKTSASNVRIFSLPTSNVRLAAVSFR